MTAGKIPPNINEHFPGLMGPLNYDLSHYQRLHEIWANHELGSLTVKSAGMQAVTIPVSPQGTRGAFVSTTPKLGLSGSEVHSISRIIYY